jgi:hypothetical protein
VRMEAGHKAGVGHTTGHSRPVLRHPDLSGAAPDYLSFLLRHANDATEAVRLGSRCQFAGEGIGTD